MIEEQWSSIVRTLARLTNIEVRTVEDKCSTKLWHRDSAFVVRPDLKHDPMNLVQWYFDGFCR